MDTSDKESSGMKSGLAGMRGWTMSLDLLCQTDDSGWQELEDIWETDRKLAHMRIVRADAVTYTGQAVMSSLSIDPPHDGVVGCAVSFEGADPLVKA
jgi:predicted secreted protein